MDFTDNEDKYRAEVWAVRIDFWYGRQGTILELYVPSLGCSFNNSSSFCEPPGNVINGNRGEERKNSYVILSHEQYETLRQWRDIELKYRREVEEWRQKAVSTCFKSFDNVCSSVNPGRKYIDRIDSAYNEEIYQIMLQIAGLKPVNNFRTRMLIVYCRKIEGAYIRYKQRKAAAISSTKF
jgi:hypothetical protein